MCKQAQNQTNHAMHYFDQFNSMLELFAANNSKEQRKRKNIPLNYHSAWLFYTEFNALHFIMGIKENNLIKVVQRVES